MPFTKGDSRINRKGAPEKEWTWGSLFREKMEECGDDKKKAKEAIAQAMIDKAKSGDTQAFKEMANRMDGMPQQAVDLTSDGEKLQPILVKFINANDNGDTNGV